MTELEKAEEKHREAAREYVAKVGAMAGPFSTHVDMNAHILDALEAEQEHRRAAVEYVRELSCSILGYAHADRELDQLFSQLGDCVERARLPR